MALLPKMETGLWRGQKHNYQQVPQTRAKTGFTHHSDDCAAASRSAIPLSDHGRGAEVGHPDVQQGREAVVLLRRMTPP